MRVINLPLPANAWQLKFSKDDAALLMMGDSEVARFSSPLTFFQQEEAIQLVASAMDHGYRCATADMRRVLNYGKE